MKELSDKNKKEGEAFLAENKKKEGVVTRPNGLQYKVLKEGTGKTQKQQTRLRSITGARLLTGESLTALINWESRRNSR